MIPAVCCIWFLFPLFIGEFGLVLSGGFQRRVTRILSVQNGGPWGTWHNPEFCPMGTFAMGYSLKIEGRQYDGDDTSLNGVKLHCGFVDSDHFGGEVTSAVGPWGVWSTALYCGQNANGRSKFLSSFVMQVEGRQGNYDDTAANFVRFKCRDPDPNYTEEVLSLGTGLWGSYGQWSESCPWFTAVCGIRTKIEEPLGGNRDDTALNNIEIYCCNE